ncbi:hypothetical protein [Pseudomonas aeruginosa]|uniref:hypothetical protein n=1 Tax=Pseudomonas aeruginosa TaxID=287 RepID=UPI001A19C870|nr:hypothetical protein [Pseudomonas aeruginosa]MBH8737412.1 hypothetical protein [Pseudomonas aeruginosa]QUI38886.1 hypothetical protein I3251_22555 [Pseudomonas aeruginosa]QUI51458.1 hypothetical protein JBL36_03945 [Pseudomonas aeruginosa]QUI56764.1 hypothetical protein JBL37_30670 [Pseudomonas aeruginosa]
MNRILDILIPRFITERVALIDANGQLGIAALRIANTDLLQRLEKAEGGRA